MEIIFITGGQRSGKSSFAQKLALEKKSRPMYVATARIWDEDFKQRVEHHQDQRGDDWMNVEAEKFISKVDYSNTEVVVVDCVTLWLTNFFVDNEQNVEVCLNQAKEEFDKFCQNKFTAIVVSNEVGMSLHAETEIGRKFTDLQGWMNQYIADKADEVYFMVAGIPQKIK